MLCLAMLMAGFTLVAVEPPSVPLGTKAVLEQVVLPGSELGVKPREGDPPVVVRVAGVWPHGTAFRYDLEYYALEPGRHDLRDYLMRKDGSSTADLPSLEVFITSLLPPGEFEPAPLQETSLGNPGGYRKWAKIAGGIWILGLLLLFALRRRATPLSPEKLGPTLEERLRPLVEEAMRGGLSDRHRAELERMLVLWWSRRLSLEGLDAAEALATLRRHEEAGKLLRQLDEWLHRPGGSNKVELESWLAPYSGGRGGA